MPVERRGIGNDGDSFDRSLQEGSERGEGSLAVLVLSEVVVGLERLEPHAGLNLMARARVEDMVVDGVEIAGCGVVGSDIAAGAGDLRRAVGGSGPSNDDGASRFARKEARSVGLDRRGNTAEEEKAGARVADAGCVEQVRREDVLLLNADDLFAQRFINEREGVLRRRVGGGIVCGVDGEEQVA